MNENILNLDSNGEHVVLARFPSEGKTLEVFGLNPEKLKSIALPNDLKEWPFTALNGCTNLENLSVYGPESEEGEITIELAHNLWGMNRKLILVQLPSTVVATGDAPGGGSNPKIFPQTLKTIRFSKRMRVVGEETFTMGQLSQCDFSHCQKLKNVKYSSFHRTLLRSLDLSHCFSLETIASGSFYQTSITIAIFPRSLMTIAFGDTSTSSEYGAFKNCSKLTTVIWCGEKAPNIASNAFIGCPIQTEIILHQTA